MPLMVYCILVAMKEMHGGANVYDISAFSGYEVSSFYVVASAAIRAGWIDKRAGLYWITERGKIAAAIETGRRTKAVAEGRAYQCQPVTHFMKKEI